MASKSSGISLALALTKSSRLACASSLASQASRIARERAPSISEPRLGNGVDAIHEMVDVLAAERSFESAEKTVAAIDTTRQKAADAARIA